VPVEVGRRNDFQVRRCEPGFTDDENRGSQAIAAGGDRLVVFFAR
jgi:hypothetical protein